MDPRGGRATPLNLLSTGRVVVGSMMTPTTDDDWRKLRGSVYDFFGAVSLARRALSYFEVPGRDPYIIFFSNFAPPFFAWVGLPYRDLSPRLALGGLTLARFPKSKGQRELKFDQVCCMVLYGFLKTGLRRR